MISQVWIVIKKHVGESSRNLQNWIHERERDLKRGNTNNSLLRHNLETTKNFNFKDSKMLLHINDKNGKKLLNFVSFQTTQLSNFSIISLSH